MSVLIEHVQASSVLNGDDESYGSHNMLDSNPDTCWNSEGLPEHTLRFFLSCPTRVASLELTFQAGFVGRNMRVGSETGGEGAINGSTTEAKADELACFEPEETNEPQLFRLPTALVDATVICVNFCGSTDFYGRIVIYSAKLFSL